MPIVSISNNHVLPPNARSADVARQTLNAAIPVQSRKTDAAFQVNGYTGVLYSYLTSGEKCACQARDKALHTRLDKDGKAPSGAINEMLSTTGTFGIQSYASRPTLTPAYAAQKALGRSFLEVDLGPHQAPVPLAALFDTEDIIGESFGDVAGNNRDRGGLPDIVDSSGENPNASVIVEHDEETDINSYASDFDVPLMGHSDVSCPICFGSGYIGGYDIMHGYRKVFNCQDTSLVIPDVAEINMDKEIPSITTTDAAWTMLIPFGCIGIDAFRVWNETKQIYNWKARIDGNLITSENDLFTYCDGKPHLVALQFDIETEFTHLEIQVNQSDFTANFELPKLAKSSSQSLREATEPFQVFLSPRVPTVKALDIIVESTYGKALQVATVTGLNDKYQSLIVGWEVGVRPTQPQELFSMLPRRRVHEHANNRRVVLTTPNSP